jgi:starvation-inducible DNA-binding protein
MIQDKLGKTEKGQALLEGVNQLLADFQLYYQNLRAFHWYVNGPFFYQLHPQFENLYHEAAEHIDSLAERLLTLGGKPHYSFQAYLDNSRLQVYHDFAEAATLVQNTVDMLEELLRQERELLVQAQDLADEGSVGLLSELVAVHEKHRWMLRAWLGK